MESWVDSRLDVTNNIVAWYDLSRQTAARGAHGLSPLQSWRDFADIVFDGSGAKRDLTQPIFTSRPAYKVWASSSLRFDGVDDWLGVNTREFRLKRATVFIVAKPEKAGNFAGLFSAAQFGANDYVTGLNIDLGAHAVTNLAVNVEGAGSRGAVNLVRRKLALNKWHVFAVTVGNDHVSLLLDEIEQRDRPRDVATEMALDEMVVGARFYSNTPDRPSVQNHFAGEINEVLIYGDALDKPQRDRVQRYLRRKYGLLLQGMENTPLTEGSVPLETVSNPPPVQVFAPGFSVRDLPVGLNNINNVRYRPDGKLLALGYDGRIWLLSDTDGDGVEDRVEPFWDKETIRAPIGAALTPPGYKLGDGVFIAAKEKVCLVLDTNGDNRADQEITVATWKEHTEQKGVDALGVAVGPDGSVYFSLGTASFTEPYLIDKTTGKARYNTGRERGTIQRVSADFRKRETVCTGIRFAVGLAFNSEGDLFATDQEGATWRPDGNPFDELLHIQPGRHYGFPPRHPRYLPNVIDEPSTFDYAPQHQSACGLQFNEPVNGGPTFGPPNWRGDAFVTGYSRGKVWRTKLVKTPTGYVAQNNLFATLQSLVIDACVSPRGDLLVATHSGQPDWGSGPSGKGKIYRIHYDQSTAQPIIAWNESPTELRVLFDRKLTDEMAQKLAHGAKIEGGRYVSAGDRFETVRPGYQAVYDQLVAPRYLYRVVKSQLSADGTELSLFTNPRTTAFNYAVTLNDSAPIDLLTDLTGVRSTWKSSGSTKTQWKPHLDTGVNKALARPAFDKSDHVQLDGKLDLFQMLQPAIQPGASIDWTRPAETVTVHFASSVAFNASVGIAPARAAQRRGSQSFVFDQTITAPGKKWVPYHVDFDSAGTHTFTASWSTADDPRERPFPLRRLLLPWAEPDQEVATAHREIAEISGGDWQAGRQLFYGTTLACSRCHTIHGEGGHVGPDLSNLVQRDYASVRKDIEFPNAAINPDHVASNIELNDGDVLTALVQKEDSVTYTIAQSSGAIQTIQKSDVKSVKPARLSLMPEGLWKGMTEQQRRDLMTFLLTEQ
jgi:putative heme-binding domain-containing protein